MTDRSPTAAPRTPRRVHGHAVRHGVRRGWHEFMLSLRSAQDQGFYLFSAAGVLTYLWFNRGNEIEDTGILLPQVAMPSILGAMIAFGVVIGPAYSLAMEREDGTLLRMKAIPHGITGYVTGQLVYHSLGLVPFLVTVLVPGALLFDGVMPASAEGWLTVTWVLVLGLFAALPIGIVIGSLVPSVQKVGTWGMLPILILVAISGIFTPVQSLWGWVQGVAQAFPMYWLGHGMRAAFLPSELAVLELGGSWRLWQTAAVLAAWGTVGCLVTPVVLRRMARRQSGAAVAQAREAAGQFVR